MPPTWKTAPPSRPAAREYRQTVAPRGASKKTSGNARPYARLTCQPRARRGRIALDLLLAASGGVISGQRQDRRPSAGRSQCDLPGSEFVVVRADEAVGGGAATGDGRCAAWDGSVVVGGWFGGQDVLERFALVH